MRALRPVVANTQEALLAIAALPLERELAKEAKLRSACVVPLISRGHLVATLVTLVIVPVLYVVFIEDLHLVRWDTEPGHGDAGGSQASTRAHEPPTA
jgi:hypothetical protein